MNELVSVIVPIYNTSPYLSRCMQSLLCQTHTNMEIILVDDGSSDNSLALCMEYAQQDKRVQVVHKENGGLSTARNAGLDVATGEYLYFLDSDDYIEPLLLERALAAIKQDNHDLCLFCSYYTRVDRVNIFPYINEEVVYRWQGAKEKVDFLASEFFYGTFGWNVWRFIFRRSIVEKNRLRFISEREVMAEDLLFTYCYLLHTGSLICIPDILYHYIVRGNSLMGLAVQSKIIPKYNVLMQRALDYTRQIGAEAEAEAFFAFYATLMCGYAKNLWMLDRCCTLPQIRTQFTAIQDQTFFREQMDSAVANRKMLSDLHGVLRARVMLAHIQYIEEGKLFRFFWQAVPCLACLYVKRQLRRWRNGRRKNGKQ